MVAVGKYMALPWKMIKRAFMFAPADGISVNDVSGRLSDLNDYLPEGFVAGDRSAAFMKWRVGENPRDRMTMLEFQKEGNPVGYAICKFVHRCVEITEIRGTRQNDRRIIAALLRYIDSNKLADSVDFWTLGNSSANLHPTGPGFFKRHFTGSLFIKHHRRCRLPDEPNRWAISYLDSDW
jgi:hypothetical protein